MIFRAQSGGRRRVSRFGKRNTLYRSQQFEYLEDRRMLAASDEFTREAPYVIEDHIDPTYRERAVSIDGVDWRILDRDDSVYFQISSAVDATGQTHAVVTLDTTWGDPIDEMLHFTVETSKGGEVIARFNMSVELMGTEFLQLFYQQRHDAVAFDLANDATSTASETESGATVRTRGDVIRGIADSALNHNFNGETVTGSTAADFLTLIEEISSSVNYEQIAELSEYDRDSLNALGDLGFVMVDSLKAMISGADPTVAAAASRVKQDIVSKTSSYYTLWSGFEVNHEIERNVRRGGNAEDLFTLYESGFYDIGHGLAISLERPASIAASVDLAPNVSPAIAPLGVSLVNGPGYVQDTYVRSISSNPHGGETLAHVAGMPSDIRHALFGFDLTNHDLEHVSLASLSLHSVIAQDPGVPIEHVLNAITNAWDDDAIWNDPVLSVGPDLATWQPVHGNYNPALDVTEAVQRVLRFGDMNINGVLDIPGVSGDIELFHTAVLDFDAYVEAYEFLASYNNELVHRGDSNWDNVIDVSDVDAFFVRHGLARGDYNLDGSVGGADWTVWQDNFNKVDAKFQEGDGNFNGVVDAADYAVWYDNVGVTVVPSVPMASFQVSETSPAGPLSVVKYATSEASTSTYPVLTLTSFPDAIIKDFRSEASELRVDYNVVYAPLISLSVEIIARTESTDQILMTHPVTAGGDLSVGHHEIAFAANFGNDPNEDYELYARLVPTFVESEQSTLNNELLFAGGVFVELDGTWQAFGSSDHDVISLSIDAISITGESATEELTGLSPPDPVKGAYARGGSGDDAIVVKPDFPIGVTVYGGAGNDTLVGGNFVDTIHGGDGADVVVGMGGNDFLYGDTGNDLIHTDGSNNSVFGGDGDDEIHSESPSDLLNGGSGTDSYVGDTIGQVTDESGDRQVFRSADGSSVNVTQSGPVILAIGNPTVDAISDAVEVRAGTTVYLDVWAHDTDGDNISYSLRNLPSSGWGTYLPEMDGNGLGSINWTAPPQTAGYPTSMTFEVVATSGFSPALEDSKSITFNLVDHPWQAPYTLYDHPGVDGAPTTHDKEFFIRRQETGTSTPIVIDLLKGFGEADFYNSVQSGNSTLNEPFIRIIDDTGQTLEPEQIPQIVEWDFLEDKTRIENGTTIQEPYQDVNVSERTLDFGQIKYVPTPGFLGLDVIEYELTHDTSNGPRSNTAKIYINVEGVEVQNVSIEYPWRDNAVACACTCSCTLDGKMKVEPTSANIRSSTPLGTVNASYRPDYAEEIVRVDFRYYYGGRVFSAIDLNYKMEFLSEGASELQPVLGHIINNRTTDNNELGTFYFSVNTPNIPSGVYKYQLDTWIQTHASEPDQSAHFVTAPAWITLVRPDNVGIGKGWTIGGSEQLLINPDDADGQILWIRDDGYILTFPFVGGPADRDPGYSMLSKVTDSTTNITTYVITDKFGNEKHFDGNLVSDLGSEPFISGLLLKKRDTYGNELEFGWSPNIIEEPQTLRRVKLSTIQNSYDGRQYHVDYDSGSSYASQMREVLPGGGTQTFGFNYSAGSVGQLLSTITYPDPDGSGDGGGPEVSPTALFGYDDDRLTSYTNPDVFSEDFSLKGDIISRSIGGEPSRHTVTPRFQPYSKIYAGLKVGALQGIYYDEDVSAPLRGGGISDEYGRLSIYDVNGSWISQIIDPAGRMFVYDYNSVGQVERSALYDDVTGGLLDETIYGYDDHYNLETVTHFDGSSVRWKYDTFSRPTEYTDELGRRTTFVHQYEGTTPKILQTIVRHEMPADGSGLDNDIVVTYDYSTQGELSSITQYLYNPLTLETKNIVTGFAYGGPGRSLSETVFAAGTSDEQRIVYQDFDTQGNPQEVREYFDATSFRTTALEYDALNRVTSVTLPAPGDGQLVPKVTYDYWPSGRLKTQTETDTTGGAGSVATRYDYHFGDLSKVTRDFQGPDESATEYLYNYVGEVWATIDPLGQTTNYIYDRIDQLIATVSPDPDDEGPRESSREFYGYDRRGDNVFVLDPRFNLSAYSYDARHRLTGVFGPHFSRTFFTYDPAGQMLHLTDAEKRTTSYEYDAAGRPIRITRPEQLTSTLFTFDTLSNTVAVTDELDRELRAEYDDRNRLTLLTQNYGSGQPELEHWVKYAYYRDGNLDWSEELVDIDNGVDVTRITTYQYDGAGRLKNEVLPEVFDVVSGTLSTPIWNYKYDERGNVAKITDPLSNQTSYEYDHLNRVSKSISPDAGSGQHSIVEYVWDANSQLKEFRETVDSLLDVRKTRYDYDNLGLLIREVGPNPVTGALWGFAEVDPSESNGSPFVRYEYDANGNRTAVLEPLSYNGTIGEWTFAKTEMVYDGLNRVTKTVDPDNGETLFAYDRVGNTTKLTDPAGNQTQWVYDSLDRTVLESTTFGTRNYTYDVVGRLERQVDRNGRVVDFVYDNLDRITDEYWYLNQTEANVGPVNSIEHFTYGYDTADRLLSAGDTSHTYTYQFDDLNRLASTSRQLPGLTPAVDTDYNYDLYGNLRSSQHRVGAIDDFRNAYTYDALNRIDTILQQGSAGGNGVANKLIDIDFDLAGQLDLVKRYAGSTGTSQNAVTVSEFDFDKAGRVGSIKHRDGDTPGVGTVLAGYSYTFDPRNQLRGITNQVHPDEQVDYNYDNRRQLEEALYIGAGIVDEDYAYDANGNRDLATNANGTAQDYEIETFNRLLSDGTFDYLYDAEGNRTVRTNTLTGETTTYEWDNRNRLVKVIMGGVAETANWPMNGGSTIEDIGPNGFDGTHVNTTWDTTDASPVSTDGTSLYFNGTNAYANLGTHDEFEIQDDDFSLSMWFNIDAPYSDTSIRVLAMQGKVHSTSSTDSISGWLLRFRPNYSPDRLEFIIDTGVPGQGWQYNYLTDANLINGWHHIAVTIEQSSNTIRMYLDGVLRTTTAGTPTVTTDNSLPLYLGYFAASWNPQYFYGNVDDVRVYKETLTLDQITNLYTSDNPLGAGGVVENSYDYLNQWIGRTQDLDGDPNTTNDITKTTFIHDMGQMVMQFDGQTSGDLAMSNLSHRYLWGPGVDQLLADEVVNDLNNATLNDVYWALTDHLGSVRDLAVYDNGQTTVAVHKIYDSFGNVTGETNPQAIDELFGFTGRPFDDATGLQNNLHRWYDNQTGRWISEDPIGFAGGDGNLTRYVQNKSLTSTDPSGLANLWNPLTWGLHSDAEQTWIGFVNPMSHEVWDSVWAFEASGVKTVGSVFVTAGAVTQDATGFDSTRTWELAYRLGPHGQLANENAPVWVQNTAMGANVGGLCAAGGALAAGPTAGFVGYGSTIAVGGSSTEAAATAIIVAERGAMLGAIVGSVTGGFEAARHEDANSALLAGVNTSLHNGLLVGFAEGLAGPHLGPNSKFTSWLNQGAAGDAEVLGLRILSEKWWQYQIGNRTYAAALWSELEAAGLAGGSVEATIARGTYLIRYHPWRAFNPFAWVFDFLAGIPSTIGKGPDAASRSVIQPCVDVLKP